MPVAEDVELLINQVEWSDPDFDKMPNLKFLYLVFNELSRSAAQFFFEGAAYGTIGTEF